MTGARDVGDPSADALVESLCRQDLIWVANAHLSALRGNDDALAPSAPAALIAWSAEARRLPAWADAATIARAQRWAKGRLPFIVTALFCGALPTSYAAARGARVVHHSGRLRDDLDRRVHETGVFLLDVLRPGGLGPTGRGVVAALKVRLVHAAVRHHLAPRIADEVAINQEDLLGTLLSFSIVIIDCLRRMGVDVSREEEHAYLHLWCVVGSLMGIERARLPTNAGEARLVAQQIAAREFAASDHGRELAERLFARIDEHLPNRAMRGLPKALASRLLEPRARAALGLAEPRTPPWLRSPERLDWIMRSAAALATLAGPSLVELALSGRLEGRPASFAMPAGVGEETTASKDRS
jgi:hypothetical protein